MFLVLKAGDGGCQPSRREAAHQRRLPVEPTEEPFPYFAAFRLAIASCSHVSGMMKKGVSTSPSSMLIQVSPT